MTKLVALDSVVHASKAWKRPDNYGFVAQDAVVTITGLEFSQVGLTMPIAFIPQGDRYDPVAVMSLLPGRNMFVGPSGHVTGGENPRINGAVAPVGDVGAWPAVVAQRPEVLETA